MFRRPKSRRHPLTDAAREAMNQGAESAAELENYVRHAASDAQAIVRGSAHQVRRSSGEAYGDLTDIVRDHPAATIAIAFAIGALTVSLLKR